jgi:hypothetical protein
MEGDDASRSNDGASAGAAGADGTGAAQDANGAVLALGTTLRAAPDAAATLAALSSLTELPVDAVLRAVPVDVLSAVLSQHATEAVSPVTTAAVQLLEHLAGTHAGRIAVSSLSVRGAAGVAFLSSVASTTMEAADAAEWATWATLRAAEWAALREPAECSALRKTAARAARALFLLDDDRRFRSAVVAGGGYVAFRVQFRRSVWAAPDVVGAHDALERLTEWTDAPAGLAAAAAGHAIVHLALLLTRYADSEDVVRLVAALMERLVRADKLVVFAAAAAAGVLPHLVVLVARAALPATSPSALQTAVSAT